VGFALDGLHKGPLRDLDEPAASRGPYGGGAAMFEEKRHLPEKDILLGKRRNDTLPDQNLECSIDNIKNEVADVAFAQHDVARSNDTRFDVAEDARHHAIIGHRVLHFKLHHIAGIVEREIFRKGARHENSAAVRHEAVGSAGRIGYRPPVEAGTLIDDTEFRRRPGDRVLEKNPPRRDCRIFTSFLYQSLDIAAAIKFAGLFIVADSAVAVLYRIRQ